MYPPSDPNADLSGYVFRVETSKGVVDGTVIGSASWSSAYVELETEHGRTVRVAAQVRRRKELES
jgi:hypothetical protein